MNISKWIKLSFIGLMLISINTLAQVRAEEGEIWSDINSLQISNKGMMKAEGAPGGKQGQFQKNFQDKEKLFQQLDLTDEQKEKLKTLFQNKRQQNQAEHQAIMTKRQQLMEMLKTGSGSKDKALALHREISQDHSNMMAQRINMIYDLRSILTPEQFEKFQTMMHGKFKNKKPGGGGPAGMQGGARSDGMLPPF